MLVTSEKESVRECEDTQPRTGGRGVCRVVHIVFRLDVGGLENGLVNLINQMPADRYDHSIICLTESTSFADRIERTDVRIIEIRKKAGKDFKSYWRMWKAIR